MQHAHWLTLALTYLAAAVIAVPLARRLGLGAIIGYLGAGFAIGPWGLRVVTDPSQIVDLADFGVVLMLFLIGLELEPKRLWAMRRPIFGWGSVQLIGSLVLIAAIGWGCLGFTYDAWPLAVVAGAALAMSSTAIGLATLDERNILQTTVGQSVLSVSLLQDIAAIPLLALIPLMAPDRVAGADAGHPWIAAARAFGMIALIVLGGRLALRPALRFIARSQTPEIFTAAALALVVGTAALMQAVGLSMALGAFLAGVLLAESEYRRELETDIEPFKGLLLGLFFIAVGMGIDVGVVIHHPWQVAGIVFGFLLVKTLVLWGMEIGIPIPRLERPIFTLLLAQGGEFGFVVLQAAQGRQVIAADEAGVLTAAITLSMLLTPVLMLVADRWWIPMLQRFAPRTKLSEIAEPQDAPVIIAGFGRYGQIIGRLLHANGITATVFGTRRGGDRGAAQVRLSRALRRRHAARPAARRRRREGARAGGGDRQHRAQPRAGRHRARELPQPDHRRARPQCAALVPAERARRAAHRARDARFVAHERPQRARGHGLPTASRAHAGDAFPPPFGAAAARAGAALSRRVQADLAGARRSPAAGAAVRRRNAWTILRWPRPGMARRSQRKRRSTRSSQRVRPARTRRKRLDVGVSGAQGRAQVSFSDA